MPIIGTIESASEKEREREPERVELMWRKNWNWKLIKWAENSNLNISSYFIYIFVWILYYIIISLYTELNIMQFKHTKSNIQNYFEVILRNMNINYTPNNIQIYSLNKWDNVNQSMQHFGYLKRRYKRSTRSQYISPHQIIIIYCKNLHYKSK